MKKLISLAMVALLALGANVSAQEETSSGAASSASGSTIGGIATTNVVIGAVALGVAVAIIANDDDDGDLCAADEIEQNGQCVCPTDQVKFNGICTPQTVSCESVVLGGKEVVGQLDTAEDLCVVPANTVTDTLGNTITTTFTYLPTTFP